MKNVFLMFVLAIWTGPIFADLEAPPLPPFQSVLCPDGYTRLDANGTSYFSGFNSHEECRQACLSSKGNSGQACLEASQVPGTIAVYSKGCIAACTRSSFAPFDYGFYFEYSCCMPNVLAGSPNPNLPQTLD